MREIKFRAWDKEDKTMRYDVGVYPERITHDYSIKDDLKLDFYYIINPTSDRFILCQFTGLKDINGREIYEGDIVIWGHIEGWYKEVPVRIAIVEFNPDIQFNCINLKRTFLFGQFAYQDTHNALEVIGNIYENPELLAAQSKEKMHHV